MSVKETIRAAIEESVDRDRVVYLGHSDDLSDALLVECDDWVDRTEMLTEFWGTHGGAEWRIHLQMGGRRTERKS